MMVKWLNLPCESFFDLHTGLSDPDNGSGTGGSRQDGESLRSFQDASGNGWWHGTYRLHPPALFRSGASELRPRQPQATAASANGMPSEFRVSVP